MDWIDRAKRRISIEMNNLRNASEKEREEAIEAIIRTQHPEPPLLQCVDCRNTESCAGAMAREFNKGRCLHCGGFFKVVRA